MKLLEAYLLQECEDLIEVLLESFLDDLFVRGTLKFFNEFDNKYFACE